MLGEVFFLLYINKGGRSHWYWYGSDAAGHMVKNGRRVDLLAERMGISVIRPNKVDCIQILQAAVSRKVIVEGREIVRTGRRGVEVTDYFARMLKPKSTMVKVLNDRRSSDLSLSYLRNLSDAFDCYARPRLAGCTMGTFTSAEAFNLTRRLSEDGVSRNNINSVIKALRMVFGYATMCGEILEDPTRNLKLYNVKGKEREIFTTAEARDFLDWFRENDHTGWVFMEFAIRTGARCSEILALDATKFTRLVNTDGEELPYYIVRIDGSWDRKRKAVGPTKGRYSRDTVIPQDLAGRLLSLRRDGLLFAEGRKRQPLSRFHFERLFNKACNAIGIDEETRKERGLTLHSLRHFAITMQHEMEGEVSKLSQLIRDSSGHRSVSMDRHYTHSTVEKLYAIGLLAEKVLD